jgi:hypothetical protein
MNINLVDIDYDVLIGRYKVKKSILTLRENRMNKIQKIKSQL